MNERLGFIGVGAMGGALVHGLAKAGTPAGMIDLCIRREEKAKEFADLGHRVSDDPISVVTGADVIVIAVKPRDVAALLEILPGHVTEDQVVLSVVAGVPTSAYEAALGEVPVIRAMPNTPAIVGEGIAAACRGAYATEEHLALAMAILDSVGSSRTTDEATLDAVTAISGTGPAYVFLLAEALTAAALREGIPRSEAEALVNQTIRGAGHLLTDTDASSTRLRGQVTSPGGTTAAAVHVLEEKGFRALVEDAVRAAAARSRELGQFEDT
ncbi:MAG: pyrroline-5-carboxylate reductase [Acidimicrobiia bacterium]|nr:pyrroline-5-carboxylate reductase [Acidimicrobiia bacterium]